MGSGQPVEQHRPRPAAATLVRSETGQVLSLALGAALAALLLVVFAALPAANGKLAGAPRSATGAPLAPLDCAFLLARARAEDWRKLELPVQAEWVGPPLAVVAWSPTDAVVVLRDSRRTDCGNLIDARLHDSRFNAGIGSVLRPPKSDDPPIEVWISPGAWQHWSTRVAAGEATALQRQDGLRGALRIATMTCALVLIVCSLIAAMVARSGEFVRYALVAAVFALWVAELTAVSGYPSRWLVPAAWSAAVSVALVLPLVGYAVRIAANECDSAWRWPHLDAALRGALLASLPLAVLILLAPPPWLGMLSRAVELLAAIWLVCAIGMGCATLPRAPRIGSGMVLAALPLAVVTASASWDPSWLSGIRAEATSASATWMALLTLLLAALRLGNERDDLSRMSQLAYTDPLTGLPNRRGAMNYLQQQLGERPDGAPRLVLAALDIDHFKQVNDDYGHARGDLALQRFAVALRRSRRTSDLVARIGGEEFLLALPAAELEQMIRVLKAVRAELQSAQTSEALGFPLRFSAGIVAQREGEPLNALLQEADRQLYVAKRQGRNRDACRSAEPSPGDLDQSAARS